MDDKERIFPNIKYGGAALPAAVITWVILYFVGGIVAGRWLERPWVGVLWMAFGGILFAGLAWRCLFPKRLVVHRDGFRIERTGFEERGILAGVSRMKAVVVELGWGKIHEARWIRTPTAWRRRLGPLIFIEPLRLARGRGDHRLLVSHAGLEIELREDEIEHLEQFVNELRRKNILGLGARTEARRR